MEHPAELTRGAEMLAIGLALAFVDDELAIAPAARQVEHLPQVVHGVDIGAQGNAADHLFTRFERRARRSQDPISLRQIDRRPRPIVQRDSGLLLHILILSLRRSSGFEKEECWIIAARARPKWDRHTL